MIEHHEMVCEDLRAADRLLARYFGPTTEVRKQIAAMVERHIGMIATERQAVKA